LIPDIVRALDGKQPVEIRFPSATRSWQHVLDCLSGYLLLGERLLAGRREFAQAWNFGPNSEDHQTVGCVLEALKERWPEMRWRLSDANQPHEATFLHLDISKAKSLLGWQPVWSLGCALNATAQWYRQFTLANQMLTHEQIVNYVEAAKRSGCVWAES